MSVLIHTITPQSSIPPHRRYEEAGAGCGGGRGTRRGAGGRRAGGVSLHSAVGSGRSLTRYTRSVEILAAHLLDLVIRFVLKQ